MKAPALARLLLTVPALLAVALPAAAEDLRVVSSKTVGDVPFPESVAYDPVAKVLYVSEFVSDMRPADKDGAGRIARYGLDGRIIESRFLPGPFDKLNKPKGIWVSGERLWVTDIDSVWVFDTRTREGRQVALPGAQFANDVTVKGGSVYVSDNVADIVFRIDPADFLHLGRAPTVTRALSGKSIFPNGLYPARDGSLLMVGYGDEPRGIYKLSPKGELTTLAKDLGKLDGLYQRPDGTLLVTDWHTGSLFSWSPGAGRHELLSGFGGPADFGVIPQRSGLMVVVPDLEKSELRFVRLVPP